MGSRVLGSRVQIHMLLEPEFAAEVLDSAERQGFLRAGWRCASALERAGLEVAREILRSRSAPLPSTPAAPALTVPSEPGGKKEL